MRKDNLINSVLILGSCILILTSCKHDKYAKEIKDASPYFTNFFTGTDDDILRNVNFNLSQDEVKKIEQAEEIENPNVVKAVFSTHHKALYFSRSVVPFPRNIKTDYYKHIGIYAYREAILHQLTQLSPTPLEQSESLEQLRWLENGFSITVVPTTIDTIGIDTPDDLKKITL
mgnify:CR=1 FL=1